MELRHLRYFRVLAEELHFTRAAQMLNITQSTLSHQIIQLEEELGAPLFHRRSRAVHLTSSGELFLSHAKLILRQADIAQTAVAEIGTLQRGTIRIGTIPSFNRTLLRPVIADFMQSYPRVRIVVHELTTSQIEAGLIDGTFDFGIAVAPVHSTELVMENLFVEQYVAVCRVGNPFFEKGRCSLADLSKISLAMLSSSFATRHLIDLQFEALKLVPFVQLEVNSIGFLLHEIRESELATILPQSSIVMEPGLRSIPIVGSTLERTCGLCWHREGFRSDASKVIADMIRDRIRHSPVGGLTAA